MTFVEAQKPAGNWGGGPNSHTNSYSRILRRPDARETYFERRSLQDTAAAHYDFKTSR